MRITVMTLDGSLYGLRLLNLLQWSDIPVAQALVFTDTFRRNVRLVRRAANHFGWHQALHYSARHMMLNRQADRDVWRGRKLQRDYRQLATRVDHVRAPRSLDAIQALRDGGPDLCLLGQSGIIPRSVLKIPRLATLNAHPGVLPDYRGIDTCYWALYERCPDFVGSTLHVVDAGIDTGRILEIVPYEWTGDETVNNLPELVYEDCIDLLVRAVSDDLPSRLDRAKRQQGGRYYHLMPPRLLPHVDSELRLHLAGLSRHGAFSAPAGASGSPGDAGSRASGTADRPQP